VSRHRARPPILRRLVAVLVVVLVVVVAAGTVALVVHGIGGRTGLSSLTVPTPTSSSARPTFAPRPGPGCPPGFTRYHGSDDARLACVRPIPFPTR
jgi:hypothetical protein